ncbi:DMT family transporter [Desertibacillus haloalkaliphilus]|uniref:DMT family transporter n=1 Tax=Desertibacillus haloalkaliphilus TaxID=1328930 RepID=UPI001C2763A9|nr:EamA family transporter [Desertibacillus haloalkaliphilus]MBU8907580.1 EamA family transporter [Desertibacillus haloalkaliphilus]
MVRAYLLLTITMVLFSGNILVGKAINDLPPVTITFIRCVIAFMILLPLSFYQLKNNHTVLKKEWKPIVGQAMTGIVLFNVFLYSSLQYTTSTNVAIVEATTPVFTVLLAIFILKEQLHRLQYVGVFLSLLGAIWVITEGSWQALLAIQFNRGDLLVLIAVIAWAIYSLLVKQHGHKYPLYASLTVMIAIAIVVLFPFALYEWRDGLISLLEPTLILGLLYLGIFPSVIALLFWNKGVAAIGPSRASIFLNLLPVFTIVGAVVFLGETVTVIQLIGGVLVIGGVYLSTKEHAASSPQQVVGKKALDR